MSKLGTDAAKLKVIEMDAAGYTSRKIADALNCGQSTVTDFLRKESFQKWWSEYDILQVGTKAVGGEIAGLAKASNEEDWELAGPEVFQIETTVGEVPDDCTHLMIPDTQVKPGLDLDYLRWVGEYIVDRKPDVIIHIGDHADMPSLSSYDKGTKKAEGKRIHEDIDAAIEGMAILLRPLYEYQQQEKAEYGEVRYKPRMILTIGNHEERIMRHVNANPELHGFVSYDNLRYEEFGWEVYDFLKPAVVNGVAYVHFMANPMTGKPFGGMAMNILKNVGESFTMGHKQCLDIATRFLPASGRQQWAIVAGACYVHDESYKGHQGNHHWRGVIVKHNVIQGSYNPMFVDIGYLENKYS